MLEGLLKAGLHIMVLFFAGWLFRYLMIPAIVEGWGFEAFLITISFVIGSWTLIWLAFRRPS